MEMHSKGVWALVVAAGRGERLGLSYNKVFHLLAGQPLLHRCFEALASSGCFEGAVLVLSEADREQYEALVCEYGALPLVRYIAHGGTTRQQSVANGLALLPNDTKIVAIHDAARAFVPIEVIEECVVSAIRYGSGVAATLVSDTIKVVDGHENAVDTLNRSELRAVQTPQCFQLEMINKAHELALIDLFDATDDAALVERYIGPVRLCVSAGGKQNIKLTTQEDLTLMEAEMSGGVRVGQGYDVHKLMKGRKLILCGVEIPYEKGLLGHSDADVAVHALMDALLGAAAFGDIGMHFPDNDDRYKDADSMELLREVVKLLKAHGFSPRNADVTIVCEQPKIAKYKDAMRSSLAQALETAAEAVNVKATTTEGLGFEGRGEGISATAVVTIRQGGRAFE